MNIDLWNNLSDVEKAAEIIPYAVVVIGALVSISGALLQVRLDKRDDAWQATSILDRAARSTPFIIVLVGAMVSASGIHVKGLFDERIVILKDEVVREIKNTPPEVKVRLGNAVSNGKVIPGKILLEITSKNDIVYNARWHVTTHNDSLVSGFMTGMVKIVPAATPVYKSALSIQADRVVDEYIELKFIYESVHSPELGSPPHLRGQVSLPYRYSKGHVQFPTLPMVEYWNARQSH